ncbi:unnamed protein product, partial [marine sediment metagenome]
MSDRYEYYTSGMDASWMIHGVNWSGQTFTPQIRHKITSVKIRICRTVWPGTLTVSIKATDGEGKPTGADLCSGTISANTLIVCGDSDYYEITLGAGCNLEVDTLYAIVVRALTGNGSNFVRWLKDSSYATYTRGVNVISDDSGVTWYPSANQDFMFEEWGEPPSVVHELIVTDGVALTDT